MNLFKLELEIKDAYNNKNYKEALEKINLYLSRKDSGVYGSFMFFFIDAGIGIVDLFVPVPPVTKAVYFPILAI